MADNSNNLTDGFAKFLASAQAASATGQGSTEALLSLLEPPFVAFLECLAVPHWFNEEICGVASALVGTHYTFEKALELSFVRSHPRGYTFHEITRGTLRSRLLRENQPRLREISGKLTALLPAAPPPQDEDLAFERAYLAVAADETAGFEYFDSLYNSAFLARRYAACATLSSMLDELEPLLSPEGRLRAKGYRAYAALNQHDFDTAEKLFRELNKQTLPDRFAARVTLGLGVALEGKGSFEEAARIYESGIAVLKNADLPMPIMWRLHNRAALVLIRLGDIRKAEKYVQRGLELSREIGDDGGEAATLETFGQLYDKMRDLTRAREVFEQSLAAFHRAGLEYEKSRVYLSLAALEESVSKWDAAEKWYLMARENKSGIGDDWGIAVVDANLGNLYLRRNQPEASFPYFQTSLETFRRFRDGSRSAQVLYSMAMASESLNRRAEAGEYLRSAMATIPASDPMHNQFALALQRLSRPAT